MVKCSHCGLELPDDSLFCNHCGTSLNGQTASLATAKPDEPSVAKRGVPADASSEEQVLWEAYPSFRTTIPVLIVILVAGAIAVGLLVAFQAPQWSWLTALGLTAALLAFFALWAWIRLRGTRYRLTSQRIFVQHGLFSIQTDEVELEHYRDIALRQGFWNRIMGCGDVEVFTGDESTPVVKIADVCDPVASKELIRSAARERKRQLGILRREEL